jgi:hypothetical protein
MLDRFGEKFAAISAQCLSQGHAVILGDRSEFVIFLTAQRNANKVGPRKVFVSTTHCYSLMLEMGRYNELIRTAK